MDQAVIHVTVGRNPSISSTFVLANPFTFPLGVIDHSPLIPAHFREKTLALRGKYYPIEIDPDLSVQEK